MFQSFNLTIQVHHVYALEVGIWEESPHVGDMVDWLYTHRDTVSRIIVIWTCRSIEAQTTEQSIWQKPQHPATFLLVAVTTECSSTTTMQQPHWVWGFCPLGLSCWAQARLWCSILQWQGPLAWCPKMGLQTFTGQYLLLSSLSAMTAHPATYHTKQTPHLQKWKCMHMLRLIWISQYLIALISSQGKLQVCKGSRALACVNTLRLNKQLHVHCDVFCSWLYSQF